MRFRLTSGLVGAVALGAFFCTVGASSGSDGSIVSSQAGRAGTVAALPANKLPPHPLRTPPFTPRPTPTARPSLIYVLYPNRVNVYPSWAYNGYPPIATLQGPHTRLRNASDLAFDAAGNLYVLNQGSLSVKPSITVYGPNPNGNTSPIATISGPKTGLTTNHPYGYHFSSHYFAVGATGNIYVTDNTGAGAVYVFRAGANGNVAPTAKISGTKTGFFFPMRIAVDRSGRIYVYSLVVNHAGANILIFAAGASGNVHPIAKIAGPKTGLSETLDAYSAMAFSPSGRLYVEAQSARSVFASGAKGNVAPLQQFDDDRISFAFDRLGRRYDLDSEGVIHTPGGTFKVSPPALESGSRVAWAIAVR